MSNTSQRLFVVLVSVFVTSLLVGDIIGGKLIEFRLYGHEFVLTVGMIPFPITFLLTDVLHEFYGFRAARFATMLGFAMALLAYSYIFVGGAIPIAALTEAESWQGVTRESFQNVFLGSQRMILASLCAYLVAQFADIGLFHFFKKATQGRWLWLRATGSTALSQWIDTLVINTVAWYGVMGFDAIWNIMLSSYLLKVIVAVGLTPLVYAAHALVQQWLGVEPATAN